MGKPKYYLVNAEALPEVFVKVMAAKDLLDTGAVRTVAEAVEKVCLSRSAYYKYKDSIRPLYSFEPESIVTLNLTLMDRPGVLAGLLSVFPESGANILTINQSIPNGSVAMVTISFLTEEMKAGVDELMERVNTADGVIHAEIIRG